MSWFILSLQTRKKYDKLPTFKIYTTSACILRGRNIFWTPRAVRTTAGLMPLGLFLFNILLSFSYVLVTVISLLSSPKGNHEWPHDKSTVKFMGCIVCTLFFWPRKLVPVLSQGQESCLHSMLQPHLVITEYQWKIEHDVRAEELLPTLRKSELSLE